jgi:septal ring factor EnvC (AmiA/AmiB activator)
MASTKTGAGLLATVALMVIVLAIATVTAAPRAWADDSEAQALKQVQRELHQLRADRARDRKLIENLEQKLDQVESQDSQVRTTNQQLQSTTQQLQNSNQQL